MYMTEEDEKDWGDGVEMMEYEDDAETESDVDEQDDEEEDEVEPSSEVNKDVGFKSEVGPGPCPTINSSYKNKHLQPNLRIPLPHQPPAHKRKLR